MLVLTDEDIEAVLEDWRKHRGRTGYGNVSRPELTDLIRYTIRRCAVTVQE